jgi:hypothetical protein
MKIKPGYESEHEQLRAASDVANVAQLALFQHAMRVWKVNGSRPSDEHSQLLTAVNEVNTAVQAMKRVMMALEE